MPAAERDACDAQSATERRSIETSMLATTMSATTATATTATTTVMARASAAERHRGAAAPSRARVVRTRAQLKDKDGEEKLSFMRVMGQIADKVGLDLGPIAMSLEESKTSTRAGDDGEGGAITEESFERPPSIAKLNTKEWQEKYVKADGTVDLWLEDDYNVASRKAGGVDADTLVNIENYAWRGMRTADVDAPVRNIKVTDHESGEILELDVPEGRYILFEAEQQGWVLPNACRMGGCTKCAVKISKGSVQQPESLGLSKELKDKGYALLCVATATEDVECVTQDEEEVYMMQFGKSFADMALDKNAPSIIRDDFAFEIADMDE